MQVFKMDVKRLRIPFEFATPCPSCGHTTKRSLEHDEYLSYPKANEPFSYMLYCAACGREWTIKVKLTVDFEIL